MSLPGLTGLPVTSEFILLQAGGYWIPAFAGIARGITLKGNGFADMQIDVLALVLFMLIAMGLALFRFRRTLD